MMEHGCSAGYEMFICRKRVFLSKFSRREKGVSRGGETFRIFGHITQR